MKSQGFPDFFPYSLNATRKKGVNFSLEKEGKYHKA
jgi:hypothetical protein